MKHIKYIVLLLTLGQITYAQETLTELLQQYNKKTVPYISVQELVMEKSELVILDSREAKEYEVSHIKDAICVGYNDFKIESAIQNIPNKDTKIVVYCSLGIRSEVVAEKLKKAGYINIQNLYGGIFEWKNNDYKVYNSKNIETEKIHTFNEEWSKWLLKGKKVYE